MLDLLIQNGKVLASFQIKREHNGMNSILSFEWLFQLIHVTLLLCYGQQNLNANVYDLTWVFILHNLFTKLMQTSFVTVSKY